MYGSAPQGMMMYGMAMEEPTKKKMKISDVFEMKTKDKKKSLVKNKTKKETKQNGKDITKNTRGKPKAK
jgi:hypothetical protein